MTKEITIKGKYDIEAPSQMVAMAKVLKTHIVNQNLYTPIANKSYAHVEGWQFAGGLMGLYPKVAKVENLSTDKEKKWKADVELIEIKSGKVVGFGSAICSNAENKKKTFDEYAILSMAQTRAIGKAYRNLIGWVMKLAGYEATPSEEMFKMGEEVKTATVQPMENKTDYLIQVKKILAKLGANTENKALNILEAKTGIRWKTFKGVSQQEAQKALAKLLQNR